MKKLLVLLLVLCMVATIFVGCKDTGANMAEKQEITYNWQQEPPDLDPQLATDQVSFKILNACLEGLVRLNPDGSVGDGLAEKWEISNDGLVYTFTLRDAKWSDDTPITASDFEYAWKRVINPETASEYAYQMYHIVNAEEVNIGKDANGNNTTLTLDDVGVKALDEKTLEVTLVRPTPFFLSLTSFITFVPAQKTAIETFGDEYATEVDKMYYSGPFVISEWSHEQSLTLSKNPNYWDADTVKIDKVTGYMITENNTEVQMYETGELDIMIVRSEYLDAYKNKQEYTSMADAVTWYLQFNCQDKYFSNIKIRNAFAKATDAETYVNVVKAGLGEVAKGLTPPTMAGKEGSVNFAADREAAGVALPVFNVEEAVKLFEEGLAEVGATKEEFENEVTIVCGEGDVWNKIAQFLQNQWKENLGVELAIENMSFALRLDRYDTGTYQITYSGWGGDYNDPMTFMDMFITGSGNNDAYWGNANYDADIQTAIEGSGNERIDAMVDAEKILSEELPIFPLYHPSRNFVQKQYVKNVARYPVGADIDFKWAYVEAH